MMQKTVLQQKLQQLQRTPQDVFQRTQLAQQQRAHAQQLCKHQKPKHETYPTAQGTTQYSGKLVAAKAKHLGIPDGRAKSCHGRVTNARAAVPGAPSPPRHLPGAPSTSAKDSPLFPTIEVNAQTDANHDTALTLASAGGHVELVSLLLARGADVEHRDKKGFTSLILAAAGGHTHVVTMLLDHNADIEAQLESTRDTAISLACSGGRYEVVEVLLRRGANKEHRNASDYTPLCLASSGGHVNIIRLLLMHGGEINSRTNSRLGISPLMLAAMNGHVQAVSLLLDMGSDVNAQIETNRNTALTLACFQGRHEVVALLVDRKANVEHRAKKGLTPLMEAATGGYVEVGKVLLDRGADIAAVHALTSRDTALTIAADKGHYRFVELLVNRGAPIDAKNKKGHSALWLACNGGHLEVVQFLVGHKADIDCQDNRKTSCLMAAFKKGHVKVVRWLVKHVTQLPSEQECSRSMSTISDKELYKKCKQCDDILAGARKEHAEEATRCANNLLMLLDIERSVEENKRAAAARKREKRKQKKKEKQEPLEREDGDTAAGQNDGVGEADDEDSVEEKNNPGEVPTPLIMHALGVIENEENRVNQKNYLGMLISAEEPLPSATKNIGKASKNKKNASKKASKSSSKKDCCEEETKENHMSVLNTTLSLSPLPADDLVPKIQSSVIVQNDIKVVATDLQNLKISEDVSNAVESSSLGFGTSGIGDLDDFGGAVAAKMVQQMSSKSEAKFSVMTKAKNTAAQSTTKTSRAQNSSKGGKKEEGWKEVARKCKKITVPGKSISRIIGRGGCNINAVREASGAHIDLDKQLNSTDGIVTIKGSQEATHIAHKLIEALMRDTDKDIDQLIPMYKTKSPTATSEVPAADASKNMAAKSVVSLMSVKISSSSNGIALTSSASCTGNSTPDITPRHENGDEVSKPEPIRSFPIGAWKPMSTTPVPTTAAPEGFAPPKEVKPPVVSVNSSSSESWPTIEIQDGKGAKMSHQQQQIKSESVPAASPFTEKSSVNQSIQNRMTPPAAPGHGDFSPFNNIFSKLTESVLSNKHKDNRMDFATAAASGVVSSLMSSATASVTSDAVNSALQAKAPGYRPHGLTFPSQQPPIGRSGVKPSMGAESPSDGSYARRLNFAEETMERNCYEAQLDSFYIATSNDVGVIGHPSRSGYTTQAGPGSPVVTSNMTKNSSDSGLNPNAPKFTSKSGPEYLPFSSSNFEMNEINSGLFPNRQALMSDSANAPQIDYRYLPFPNLNLKGGMVDPVAVGYGALAFQAGAVDNYVTSSNDFVSSQLTAISNSNFSQLNHLPGNKNQMSSKFDNNISCNSVYKLLMSGFKLMSCS